jgi:PilZ domain
VWFSKDKAIPTMMLLYSGLPVVREVRLNFVMLDQKRRKVAETSPEALPRPRNGLAAPMVNRRRAVRRPIGAPGSIALDETHWHRCRVHDMSATGAQIEVTDLPSYGRGGDALPECFYLAVETVQEVSLVECQVQWRQDNRAGVRFLGPIRVTPKKPMPVRRK